MLSASLKRKSSNSEAKNEKKRTKKRKNNTTDVSPVQSKEYEKLWKKVNDHFESTPKDQNLKATGVDEHQLTKIERRLGNIKLPDDIRHDVRIHNGLKKFGYGLRYRSPTIDLLPSEQWRPYEKEDWCYELFECLLRMTKNLTSFEGIEPFLYPLGAKTMAFD
ncbi:unnamed protein product [Didymodactylos carnosus]|uniref:Uncharacterized protein n=1 Tax=Didymodactylos carnosus TaxID=1234261 RepID=A0A814FAQ9_9BILA|nr:unnamed protein product [Didymodactylos carnosus]CAF1409809.1 unnamed protein product [Didymodactylos carnosus]CAF3755016.1 unnamed protein product [Didymodactylos carnosus]CAF4214203.1 unnamed protein product [Didymodactylos carnosus]